MSIETCILVVSAVFGVASIAFMAYLRSLIVSVGVFAAETDGKVDSALAMLLRHEIEYQERQYRRLIKEEMYDEANKVLMVLEHNKRALSSLLNELNKEI